MNFDKILFVGHKNDTNSPDYGLVYNSFYTSLKNLSKNLKQNYCKRGCSPLFLFCFLK